MTADRLREPPAPPPDLFEIRRDPRAENRDRLAAGGERALVRGAVDALRETGHDHHARLGERRSQLACDARAVRRHAARADDADSSLGEDAHVAIDGERVGRSAKIEQSARVARIGGPKRDHGSARRSSASETSSTRTASLLARSAAVRATLRMR